MFQNSGSFRAVIFLADSKRKKGFQPVEGLYFRVVQPKEKRAAGKEPVKRTAMLEHVNRLYMCNAYFSLT